MLWTLLSSPVATLLVLRKKEWVLEYAAKEIKEVLSHPDYWLPKIMQWIDIFKTAFNALKALF